MARSKELPRVRAVPEGTKTVIDHRAWSLAQDADVEWLRSFRLISNAVNVNERCAEALGYFGLLFDERQERVSLRVILRKHPSNFFGTLRVRCPERQRRSGLSPTSVKASATVTRRLRLATRKFLPLMKQFYNESRHGRRVLALATVVQSVDSLYFCVIVQGKRSEWRVFSVSCSIIADSSIRSIE